MGFARGGVIGGRGAYAQRRGGAVAPRNVTNAAGGGGGDVELNSAPSSLGGGEANLTNFTVESVSFNSNARSHSAPNNKDGTLTIRDADGKLHTSIGVSSGSTRVTYEFAGGFALKFENLKSGGFKGQNAADVKAYNGIVKENQKYMARPLTSNRSIAVKLNGRTKNVQVIAVERAVPIKREMTSSERRTISNLYHRVVSNGGRYISDTALPGEGDGGRGHNVFVVERKGKLSLKFVDYSLGFR